MMKRYTDQELLILLLGRMSFPAGTNGQITDAVTQTLRAIVDSDEAWLEIMMRREQRITDDTIAALDTGDPTP